MARIIVVNGFLVDKDKEYRLQDAAGILGVGVSTVRKYVHAYGFLKPRLLHMHMSVVDGAQIIYFHQHKIEMLRKVRRLRKDGKLVLNHKTTTNIAEDWRQAPPIDDTWVEDKMVAFPMQVDPVMVEIESSEYYRENDDEI